MVYRLQEFRRSSHEPFYEDFGAICLRKPCRTSRRKMGHVLLQDLSITLFFIIVFIIVSLFYYVKILYKN